jgi:methylmalonyl-CoA mutase C-terminal domain/subunit
MTLFPRVVDLLRQRGAGEIVVFAGGIIPKEDIPVLKEKGIEEIFTPGATTTDIVDWIRQRLQGRKAAS